MRNADCGRSLIDVLSSGSAGTVRVNAQILVTDFDIQVFLYVRHHITGYKGGLALSCRIKGRNAHQAVHALLRFQITIGILAIDLKGYRLNPGLIAIQIIQYLYCVSFFIRPAAEHTVEHSGPVAGLRPSRSCMERDDGIVLIILAGKQSLNPDILIRIDKAFQLPLDFRYQGGVIFLIRHLDQRLDLLM